MKKFITTILMLSIVIPCFSQRDALYYQYLYNYHILNPAFTGTHEKIVFNLTDRHQWVGLNGAPNTITFGMHTVLKNEKVGLGGYIYTDRLGPIIDFGLIATYAYVLEFTKAKLSLGLQFGFQQSRIDWDKLYMEYMDDIFLIVRPQPGILPDANFGAYYYTPQFFVGFSTKHLFEKYFIDWSSSLRNNFTPLSRNLYLYTGGFIKLDRRMVYKPSILIKYTDKGTFSFDINSCLMVNKLFWVGVSYRSNHKSFVFLTEVCINSKLNIGYSYDSYLGDINKYNIGTHEIKIEYDIILEKRRSYMPLYF